MKRNFTLSTILIFTLLLVGIYVYADEYSVNNPGHSWDEMDCDTNMCVNTANQRIGIGNTGPGYKLDVTGAIRSNSTIISTASDAFRMVSGNYGAFFRNDGSNTYLLFTASGDQYGSWNSLRPFYVSNSTGVVNMNHGINVDGNAVIDDGAGWHRTYGATGWYNGSYGGGWYMTDTTWVRSYNDKPVYSYGEIRSGTQISAVRGSADSATVGLYSNGAWRMSINTGRYGNEANISTPYNSLVVYTAGGLVVRDQNAGDTSNVQAHYMYAGGGSGLAYSIGDDSWLYDLNVANSMGVVGKQNGGAPGNIYAANFYGWSSKKYKKNIITLGEKDYSQILSNLKKTNLYSYYRKGDNSSQEEIGPIVEESPKEIVSGDAISLQKYASYLFGGMKGLIAENEEQQKEIEKLREEIKILKEEITIENGKNSKKTSFWNRLFRR